MSSDRLLTLLLLLQSRERATVRGLAEELGVTERTISRDLRTLEDADFPVVVQRGRYGGVTMLPGAQLDLTRLDRRETDAVRVAGLDAQQLAALGLDDAAAAVARKLRGADRERARVDRSGRPERSRRPALADVVVVDNRGWLAPAPDGVAPAALIDGVRDGERLRIRYRRSAEPSATWREVDPYGLLAKGGRWYLVARDDDGPHLFALERLADWTTTGEPRRLPAGDTFAAIVRRLVARVESPAGVVVTGRLRADRVDLARRILGARLETPGPIDASAAVDGTVPVRIRYDRIEAVRQLLQFGTHLTITGPPEARVLLRDLAREVAEQYADERD